MVVNFVQGFLKGLPGGFRSIPELLRALARLPRLIIEFIRILCRLCKRGRAKKERPCDDEIRVPPDTYKRADPLLYSQPFLMKMGLAVTWDNPDIQLYRNGSAVPSGQLERDTEYEVAVRVWNNSYGAPAVGLPVYLSYLSFGVGTSSTPIDKQIIDLGIKGSPDCPAFATFTWRTPRAEGHYCLQARLDWPDDANPDNNLGQENTNVGVLQSPAHFTFRVRNRAATERRFVYAVDDYALPDLPPCREVQSERPKILQTRLKESKRRWAAALSAQGYGLLAPPAGWNIQITPDKETLGPLEEIEVRVSIEPSSQGWRGKKAFNINAFSISRREERVFEGGVTLRVEA